MSTANDLLPRSSPVRQVPFFFSLLPVLRVRPFLPRSEDHRRKMTPKGKKLADGKQRDGKERKGRAVIGKERSRTTEPSHRGGDPSTPPPLEARERGYFTASPRQDRMTYFDRLLLSRGASSAALISNRKSRGEPRRRSRPIRGHRRSFLHRPRPRKNDRRPIPAAMFSPLPLPRHLHTPRETVRLLSACCTPRVASCHVVSPYRCETPTCRTILWPIRGFISIRMMDDSLILFGP